MASFQNKNPYLIGGISIAVILTLLVLSYRISALPLIGDGPQRSANFSEAAGLMSGDAVRIAGVKVGKVTSVGLENGHVVIEFRAKGVDIGNQSTASIQIQTLLGNKYLAIDPAGDKPLTGPIPLERTVAPYDVVDAFNMLSSTVQDLNTNGLAASLRTLSDTFKDTPTEVRASLQGLSRLSVTIASRNDQIAHLLGNTNATTNLLAARNQDIDRILGDGTKLLDELRAREDAISRLLDGTRRLSEQLHGLIKDNENQIGTTLNELDRLTELLQRHEDDLGRGIRRLGPFITVFSDALGTGRWFDSFVDGLVPANPFTGKSALVPANPFTGVPLTGKSANGVPFTGKPEGSPALIPSLPTPGGGR